MDLHWVTVVSLIIGALTLIGVSVTIYEAMGWQFQRGDRDGKTAQE